MPIRPARAPDLPAIVAIYNAAIPGRMATADTAPVSVQQREAWFREFDPAHRPLWVWCDAEPGEPQAWLSLRSFYGRPAYHSTVEVAVSTAPAPPSPVIAPEPVTIRGSHVPTPRSSRTCGCV